MNHRTKEFFEDLYLIAFAVVLAILAVTIAQYVGAL